MQSSFQFPPGQIAVVIRIQIKRDMKILQTNVPAAFQMLARTMHIKKSLAGLMRETLKRRDQEKYNEKNSHRSSLRRDSIRTSSSCVARIQSTTGCAAARSFAAIAHSNSTSASSGSRWFFQFSS